MKGKKKCTKIEHLLRRRGWNRKQGNLRHRIYALVTCRAPWYDWGERLMILTGHNTMGHWFGYEPPTWWYREDHSSYWKTPLTRYMRPRLEVIRGDYSKFREREQEVGQDAYWKAINVNQDDELQLGRRYWGEAFYGLKGIEVRLLARYLIHWLLRNWFGVRNELNSLGLKHHVNLKRPFACNVTPKPGSGGYSHWHCQRSRHHVGPHRYNNYTWPGPGTRVEYSPQESNV